MSDLKRNTQAPPPADPFGGEFSQERATAAATLPFMQWHGGLASLVGESDSMKINGGFFIEDDCLLDLGLDPAQPLSGFERVALRLGGKQIPGWGAARLELAFVFTEFCWEDRETGKLRFPPTEYERRKQAAPGTERELRGRLRALVAVRELMDEGVLEPLVLSVRGTYSAALNAILRDVGRMADEATKLRRLAGYEGGIPREAFWVPVHAGEMEDVGDGSRTSRVARPVASVPADLTREALVEYLVDASYRRPSGLFDQWAQAHGAAWNAPYQPQAEEAAPAAGTLNLNEAAQRRAANFYLKAISIGYWNETEVNNALRELGYTGVPLREPRASDALAELANLLEQGSDKREVARG